MLNQLTSGLNSGFTFDANGNLIQEVVDGKTITYGYDDNDRLISWSDGAQSYQYTYSGTKDLKEVEKGGEKTRYVLDVNQNLPAVVARTDGSGEILDYFVYGAAGLVSKITPAGQAFTYHFDPTGNAIAMSDSSENLVNTYAYTPYGNTTRQESIDNPFEYVGRFGVMAEDNGLYYMRARFYHPGVRRFLSQDTVWGEVSSPQSLNLYAYVEGNPVMRVDPSGHSFVEWVSSGRWGGDILAGTLGATTIFTSAMSKYILEPAGRIADNLVFNSFSYDTDIFEGAAEWVTEKTMQSTMSWWGYAAHVEETQEWSSKYDRNYVKESTDLANARVDTLLKYVKPIQIVRPGPMTIVETGTTIEKNIKKYILTFFSRPTGVSNKVKRPDMEVYKFDR